jgi:hypothetical protein
MAFVGSSTASGGAGGPLAPIIHATILRTGMDVAEVSLLQRRAQVATVMGMPDDRASTSV